MLNKETKIIKISRRLTPEHRADLLAWVRLACFAENSARNMQSREYSRENIVQRRKK
jgi:hypothetical protein